MAARPNTSRTLHYGVTLAEAQLERLTRAESMANSALSTNKLLSPTEVTAYKEAIALCRKQSALFAKITDLKIPRDLIPATKRGPGRPSTKELESVKSARSGKNVSTKAAKTAKAKAVKSSANAKAVESDAPKKRGRPAKVKTEAKPETKTDTVVTKRRGRPPKAKTASTTPEHINGSNPTSAVAAAES